MAVTPNILLSGRKPTPDKTFSNILLDLGRIEDIKTAQAEAPIRQRLLEAQTGTVGDEFPQQCERLPVSDPRSLAVPALAPLAVAAGLEELIGTGEESDQVRLVLQDLPHYADEPVAGETDDSRIHDLEGSTGMGLLQHPL